MRSYVKYFVVICCFLFVYINYANAQSKEVQDHIAKGKKLKDNKDYKGAIEEFNKALKLENDNGMTFWERAVCYENLEDYKNALSDIDIAIGYLKANKDWLYKLYFDKGFYEYKMLDYKDANADFTNSLDINPKYGKVYYYRALSYKENRDYQLAINDCKKAIELFADSKESLPSIYNLKGISEDFLDDYKSAIEDYNQALEINPKFARVYINRGDVYKEDGNNKAALADYNSAMPFYDKDKVTTATLYQKIGKCYYNEGHYKEAITNHTKALTLEPKYGLAYWNRGASYYHNNQVKEALIDLKAALPFYAGDSTDLSSLHEYTGEVYQSVNDNTRAIEEFNLAIEMNPKSGLAHYQKAVTLCSKKDYKASIAEFGTTIALYDKDTVNQPNCYNYRGYVKFQMDDNKGAIEDYNKAIAIRPKYGNAIWNRADAYQFDGDYKHAIEDYTASLDNYKDDSSSIAYIYCSMANTYIKKKTYLPAIKDCDLALQYKPGYATAYSNKGTAYKDSGAYNKAIVEYISAIDLYDNNKEKQAQMYEYIGYCHNQIGEYKQGIEAFTHAISISPKYGLAYWNRGYSYSKLKDYKTAISEYKLAIPMYENDSSTIANIHKDIGVVYDKMKDYKAAIEEHTIALQFNPKYGRAYHERGATHSHNKEYKLSIEDFTASNALYKDDSSELAYGYDWIGHSYYRMFDYKKAVECYNKALSYQPDYDQAIWNRANTYMEDGYFQKAIDDYDKVIKVKKDTDDLESLHSWKLNACYDSQQYDKALEEANIVLKLSDKELAYFYRRGKVLTKLNRKEEALKDLDKALSMDSTRKTTFYIYSLYYKGERDSAIVLFKRKTEEEKDSIDRTEDSNTMGRLYAMNNQPKEAVEWMKKAIDGGYPLRTIYFDHDYDNIRQTAEFIALVSNKVSK